MLDTEFPMGLAKAWTDAALGCMAASTSAALDMANQTLSLWSRSSGDVASAAPSATTRTSVSAPPSRSWYRAPSQSPFEFGPAWPAGNLPIPFASGWPFMAPPMGLFMTLPGTPALPRLLQSWAGMMAAAGIFLSPQRQGLDWRAFGLPALPWLRCGLPFPDASRDQPAPFSVYRSNGGHAVAQITFPNQVIAAVAFPPAAAMLMASLFRWP